MDSLSKLLAVAIGVIPSLPLLGFYLPLRWATCATVPLAQPR